MEHSDYVRRYMSNKKRPVIEDSTTEALDQLKKDRKFRSLNDTVKYLLRLEVELRGKDLLSEYFLCTDCEKEVDKEHAQTCSGSIIKKYRIKTELNGATTRKDEHNLAKEYKVVDTGATTLIPLDNGIFYDKQEEADYYAWKAKKRERQNLAEV